VNVAPVPGRTAQVRVAFPPAQTPQLPARTPVLLVPKNHPQNRRDNDNGHDRRDHHP
jgi:hypothetical protein